MQLKPKNVLYGLSLLISVFYITACGEKEAKEKSQSFEYPESKKQDVVDDYFGTEVKDPYRWLELDTAKEVKKWVKAQNSVTFDYLESIPFRQDVAGRLRNLLNHERYSAPRKKGDYYYYSKNDGLQNQSVLYRQKTLDPQDESMEVVLNPNTFSPDGTVSIGNMSFSKDGRYLAYSISRSGSDWQEAYVMDLDSMVMLSDTVKWIKFSGLSWYKNGFYYSRYDAPEEGKAYSGDNKFHKVYYHQLETGQDNDVLIHEDKEKPNRNFYAQTTDDEKYLIISYREGASSGNGLYYQRLNNRSPNMRTITTEDKYRYSVVDHLDGRFLMTTNMDAPMKKLVMVDPKNPQPENWETVLPEKDYLLESVKLVQDKIIARYLKNASSYVAIFDQKGEKQHELELPTIGTVSGFSGGKKDTVLFYTFSSFTVPPTIYTYNINTNESEVFKSSNVDFNPDDYVTEQVFYKSKDGTEVPMFLVHHKDLEKNGENPVELYAYGGFNISLTPNFKTSRLVLLENGGIFAMPNLRGGGEFGEEWHEGGMKEKKQNVFDDFIAAAEFLIDENYTRPEKLAISGRSNGGLLVGASMTQRPDLFGVAIPGVGVLDMLRFHKFTIGWAWTTEYGSSEEEEDFDYLFAYSPLHNVTETAYPATLITTADHDDRVVPAHSFKFAARLQEMHQGDAPVIIRIETDAGHGAGKPISKTIEEDRDVLSFMFDNLGVTPKYGRAAQEESL